MVRVGTLHLLVPLVVPLAVLAWQEIAAAIYPGAFPYAGLAGWLVSLFVFGPLAIELAAVTTPGRAYQMLVTTCFINMCWGILWGWWFEVLWGAPEGVQNIVERWPEETSVDAPVRG